MSKLMPGDNSCPLSSINQHSQHPSYRPRGNYVLPDPMCPRDHASAGITTAVNDVTKTSIHELPVSGLHHALWYCVAHGRSSALINSVGIACQLASISHRPRGQPPPAMHWIWAESARQQALTSEGLALRAAGRLRSRSPARANITERLAISARSEAARLEQAVRHERRASSVLPQLGGAAPDHAAGTPIVPICSLSFLR